MKLTARPRLADATGLERFLAEHRRAAPFGVLLHGGERALRLTAGVVALPAAGLLGWE